MIVAVTSETYARIAIAIGLVAALVVAGLLVMLLVQRRPDPALGRGPARDRRRRSRANTANIPQLEATAPVLAQIVDEAVVQDGYMNALTDGFGESAENGARADRHVHPARASCSASS